ncbi:MAG: bifunctional serine/threonine-protein kinase/formylglycine-generating enzyme family protein [Acidobacteria bacterium]|nr:bifunctional serine/threonine-protein kinase/formylglycine-generating enzyme family protein [Acidobacteriota bacterium]
MLGKTIAHYRIEASLGQGGMGEVFLAQDTTLDRKVALKFLAEEMQQDSNSRLRFLREAKSAASLDHPYICKIYAVGEERGKSFIAMEYVQGATLKARLAKGPVKVKEALKIAVEIAEALEEAHKKKIVHRDIKPSNIMLTGTGHVKVMDFGLAKHLPASEGEEQEQTADLTQKGSALGTVPYMSPEQIRGKPVDTRSDIFSFGLVLYELLTSVNPFRKGTTMDTAQAIITETAPPLARYTHEIPELLQHVVRKMLNKEAERRYQLMHEVRIDLEDLSKMIERISDTTLNGVDLETTIPFTGLTPSTTVTLPGFDPRSVPGRVEKGQSKQRYYVGGVSVCMAGLILVLALFWPKAGPDPLPLPHEISTLTGEMVLVAAGESLSASGEVGEVGYADFYLDRYEVTNLLFKQFCDETGRSYPPDPEMIQDYFLGKPDYPVVNVTWQEAKAFAAWAGKHLPSLQEWERAARSSDDRLWPWGNEPPQGEANLGGKEDGSEFMASVAAFPLDVSPYGVEQMAGNVAEWTALFEDGLGREVPVIKGGSWVNQLADYGETSPVVARFKPENRTRMDGVGFRCAASTEEIQGP